MKVSPSQSRMLAILFSGSDRMVIYPKGQPQLWKTDPTTKALINRQWAEIYGKNEPMPNASYEAQPVRITALGRTALKSALP